MSLRGDMLAILSVNGQLLHVLQYSESKLVPIATRDLKIENSMTKSFLELLGVDGSRVYLNGCYKDIMRSDPCQVDIVALSLPELSKVARSTLHNR